MGTGSADEPLKDISILVIDDDPAVRRVMRLMLESAGASPVLTAGAKEALRLAKDSRFQLILLDIRLPNARPGEAVSALRKAAPGTPILLITGGADPDQIREARQVGGKGPLQKPVSDEELIRAVLELKAG